MLVEEVYENPLIECPKGLAPTAAVAKARRERRVFGIITKEERRKGREFEHGRGHQEIIPNAGIYKKSLTPPKRMNTT